MIMWHIITDVPGAEIGYRAIVDADGFTVCNPSPMGSHARLIAASPDILEASKALLEALAGNANPKAVTAAIIRAQAAINQAGGI
jgi:hypothetical protein